MAAKCGFCRSTDVNWLAGTNVCCLSCGNTGPNAEGTEPSGADVPEAPTGLTATKDAEGEAESE